MTRRSWPIVSALTVALVVAIVSPLTAEAPIRIAAKGTPFHHLAKGFRNLDPTYTYSWTARFARTVRQSWQGVPPRGPKPAVLANTGAELRENGTKPTLTWVGHSTFLIQLAGVNILTDPHWGQRASPVSFAGPRRLVPPGMRFEDLPHIDAVIISHDHYDHLDAGTIERLAREHRPRFFVPLGHRPLLADWGARDVVELDWWETQTFRGLSFTNTPAQHSSGRGLRDQNLRLWSSWAIAGEHKRLFFAGDTGYTPALKEVGNRLGPFDAALIPIGGYRAWESRHPNHVNPEEAVQLFEDVHGRLMVPMHWGTFEMNREPYGEPPDRLLREAARRGIMEQMARLRVGQTIHW